MQAPRPQLLSACGYDIRPLDLVFFKSDDPVSGCIGCFERCQVGDGSFSHVGVVITHESCPALGLDPDKRYIWESTMSGALNGGVASVKGDAFFGVQVRCLDDIVQASTPTQLVAIGATKNNPYRAPTWEGSAKAASACRSAECKLQALYGSHNRRPYERNCMSLLRAMFPCCRAMRCPCLPACGDSYFCSEWAAVVFANVGMLPTSTVASHVLPMDFLGFDTDGKETALVDPESLVVLHPPPGGGAT